MSTLQNEVDLEEGELTDDSICEDEHEPDSTSKKPGQAYSLFDNQLSSTTVSQARMRPPHSDSDSASDSNADSDDPNYDPHKRLNKKSRMGGGKGDAETHSNAFVNPNFVNNGGVMPELPKAGSKNIWGSVLQEQILTAEVGSFSMEKKMEKDRDVESYDFTRAKEDDRPFLLEEDLVREEGADDLFREVVDLEKSAFRHQKNLKRKHIESRLGKRQNKRNLVKVTEKNSVAEVAYYISAVLEESKVHLITRVVNVLGRAKALEMLEETEKVEASGGMMIKNGSRRRTKGGVFLCLLKSGDSITKEESDKIFEEEDRQYIELRKRQKAKHRQRQREKQKKRKEAAAKLKKQKAAGSSSSAMEVAEDANSRSSVEGQTGSPKNPADHLSDTPGSPASCDSGSRSPDDFQASLAREKKRQAEKEPVTEGKGEGEGVTLDDVLDICDDYEFLE